MIASYDLSIFFSVELEQCETNHTLRILFGNLCYLFFRGTICYRAMVLALNKYLIECIDGVCTVHTGNSEMHVEY